MLRGLSEGFWPISSLPSDDTIIHDNHATGTEAELIMEKARDKELQFDRYSRGFNTLSPGMKVSPICLAVNKSGKTRMCTNMSYGNPSPNDLVDKSKMSIKLDSISAFIPFMLNRHKKNQRFVIWKSDCDSAFRTLPVCFQQQLRQIIRIKTEFHVDRCVNFGSSASPMIWCSYFSLILWIAWAEFGLEEFCAFMDDPWGISLTSDIVSFKDKTIPLNQAKFLSLFDFLNIPWKWEKQEWGADLEVIGHWISCDKMTISLSDEKRLSLANELISFSDDLSHPLVAWSRMTGWTNWGLNAFPLGRWALQSSWDKIAGKTIRNAHVPSNSSTRADLRWLGKILLSWDGRQLLKSFFWRIDHADFTMFCDACPSGLGMWIPKTSEGFTFSLPPPSRDIYWAELAAAVCCITIGNLPAAKTIVVFTDSENVVNLLSSHRAINTVRLLFKTAVELMLFKNLDVKVKHISGERNVTADAVSRNNLDVARANVPDIKISTLPIPIPDLDGGIKKKSVLKPPRVH